jgi:hypothetical protein
MSHAELSLNKHHTQTIEVSPQCRGWPPLHMQGRVKRCGKRRTRLAGSACKCGHEDFSLHGLHASLDTRTVPYMASTPSKTNPMAGIIWANIDLLPVRLRRGLSYIEMANPPRTGGATFLWQLPQRSPWLPSSSNSTTCPAA